MRILGVDPALAITGYGVIDFDKQRFIVVEAGIIKTDYKNGLQARLAKIYDGLSDLICEHKPDCMVLEKVYVHYQHPLTAFLLGQARGIICLAASKAKVPVVEYAATQVKKAVVGRGLASKSQIQKMVASVLGLKSLPRYNDVTDALALAITYSYHSAFLKNDRKDFRKNN